MTHDRGLPSLDRLVQEVDRVFAENGTLARAVEAFEPRPGQREMSAAAADIFHRGGVLLAQAGTGTGKTLAYLVPAILSRRRVLVSTGTKNLQEQIFFKDLPVLRAALRVPFTATYMKGRGNYLCLHRYDALRTAAEPRTPQERAYLALIDAWLPHTETGDRAELEDLPEELPFWNDISATSETCLGTECPRYHDCFVTRMRQRAAESDLVIVNHHLLCADAAVRQSAYGEVLPQCSYAIIDEAHQLEDVATQYFGVAVSSYRLDDLLRDVGRVAQAQLGDDRSKAEAVASAAADIRDLARQFFLMLTALAPRDTRLRATGDERSRVTPEGLAPIAQEGRALGTALEELAAALADAGDRSEDIQALSRRATEVGDDLRFLLKASDPDFVYFLEGRRRGVFLRAAPIDVSAIVRDLLVDRMRGTILTSATLAIGDSFEYIRRRLGIRQALELRVPSEFDFSRQAILYLPPRMPDPRSPRFGEAAAGEILEILRRTEGRAFVLFTSYAVMREVQARLAPVLDYPMLVQGTAPRSALLHEFRATPHAVLLATSSFWQGVDVAGEALSCVIVDKLPFASPADPVTAARIEAIAGRGGEPFGEYQIPIAVLTLLQGLGRLIRHRRDRGVLAILDPRVRTKAYGRRFLEALPPAPVTLHLDDLGRFFAEPASPPAARAPARPESV